MPPTDLRSELRDAVANATNGSLQIRRVWQAESSLFLATNSEAPSLVLQVRAARPDVRSFRTIGNLGFSYRSNQTSLPQPLLHALNLAIQAIARVITASSFDIACDALPSVCELSEGSFPTPYHRAYLESSVTLAPELIARYRRDGHVLVRRALSPEVLLSAKPILLATVKDNWPTDLPPVDQRPDAYSQSFTQVVDLGLSDPIVRIFTHSQRIAKMAADLMGVSGVRLFCEDWLTKEPGARITPWHQDEAVFPFDAPESITCWIPFHDISRDGGLLRFARGSHRIGLAPIENISDISEAAFSEIIAKHGFPIDNLPPVVLGDVSFHHGRTIHGAYPNTLDRPRFVLALHFFADGARLKAPTTPTMDRLFRNAAPGRAPGDPADSPRWPIVYSAGSPPTTAAIRLPHQVASEAYHVRATVLPRGEEMDVWLEHGRVRFSPVEDAEELAAPGGYLLSGLVDCHSHISYPSSLDSPASTFEWMTERQDEHAATGVTLLRDMGSISDTISSLPEHWGLPRVQSAGLMILPYDEPPFTCTKPEQLVEACIARIERGASWVKIFADWTDDFRGRFDTGFSFTDEVSYPLDVLAKAVSEVHARGGRVAAHCFTRAGAEVAIAANVDSLEHGWGVDEDLVRAMADRGIAWVPIVGIATLMWDIARREQQPERVQWIETMMQRLAELFPLAHSLGVRILAGTDRFPEVTVPDEVLQLAELGLSPTAALAGGSWSAREWLRDVPFTEGAPADLVLYREDPRANLQALYRPELVLIGGKRIEPSFAHVRPRFRTWSRRHEQR